MLDEKDYLKNRQYKDSKQYENRMKVLDYSYPPLNHWQWLAEQHNFAKANSILEIGCGPAIFWRYIDKKQLNAQQEITLTDFSTGMLATAKENIADLNLPCRVNFVEADVEQLIFPDNSFDAILAHLMLYHVSAPEQALHEMKRVLKPTGWLAISTLLPDINKKLFEIAHELEPRIPPISLVSAFTPEQAESLLKKLFKHVEQQRVEVTLKYPNAMAILPFIRAYPNIQKLNLPEEFFLAYEKRITAIIAEHGLMETKFGIAFFYCTN